MGYSGVARTTPGGGVRILTKLSSKEEGGAKKLPYESKLTVYQFYIICTYIRTYVCMYWGGRGGSSCYPSILDPLDVSLECRPVLVTGQNILQDLHGATFQ